MTPEPRPEKSPVAEVQLAGGRSQWLLGLVIVVLVAVTYIPAMQGGFVWDDTCFVTYAAVSKGLSGLWEIWFSPEGNEKEGHYWPFVYSSFWLEHKLWGFSPAGYHIVNVLFHIANSLLVWRLMLRLGVPAAWLVAAVFSVHPLRVESVAWVIERKDVLSGFLYLAIALIWIRSRGRPRGQTYVLALILFALALLSKSAVVTLPAALLLWHWWKCRPVSAADLMRLAPFFAIGLGITLADLAFYQGREPLELGYSLLERIQIATMALWWYAAKIAWPAGLDVIYRHWEIGAGEALPWLAVFASCLVAVALLLARRHTGDGPLVGAMYFAITLSPVLGFIDYGYMQFSFVADRFQYLGGLGVTAVLIGAAAHAMGFLRTWRYRGALSGVASAALIAVLGTLTWLHASLYRDGEALFSHIVSRNPSALGAHLNLANALVGKGRYEEALDAALREIEKHDRTEADSHLAAAEQYVRFGNLPQGQAHWAKAVELKPRNPGAMVVRGSLLRKRGAYEEAIGIYDEALALRPENSSALIGAADAYFQLERYAECIETAERAEVSTVADSTRIRIHLLKGRSWQRLGDFAKAEHSFESALELTSGSVDVLLAISALRLEQGLQEESLNLLERAKDVADGNPRLLLHVADELRNQDRHAEAIQSFGEFLEVATEPARGYAGLGLTQFALGQYEGAIESISRSLELEPDLGIAGTLQNRLGQAWQHLGQLEHAERHFEAAIAIDPDDSESVDRLALLVYQQGRFDDAARWYSKLVKLWPQSAQTLANLAASRAQSGKFAEAIKTFEQALSLDPNSSAARQGLALARSSAAKAGR